MRFERCVVGIDFIEEEYISVVRRTMYAIEKTARLGTTYRIRLLDQ